MAEALRCVDPESVITGWDFSTGAVKCLAFDLGGKTLTEVRLPTPLAEVMRAQDSLPAWPVLSCRLRELQVLAYDKNPNLIRAKIKQIIPTYQWEPEVQPPEMLGETFTRQREGVIQEHTRQSVLTRLVMHDSFHCGEVSSILGAHGLEGLDPWD